MGKKSISDAGQRLKAMNDALAGFDQMRAEIDRLQAEIELLRGYRDEAEAEASIAMLAAERLRLTGAERYAIIAGLRCLERQLWADAENLGGDYRELQRDAATLRGLLNRLSPIKTAECDRPKPIATPEPQSTPAECSVATEWTSRPHWVDPPSGHRYGFPRLYDPAADGDMTEWLIANGYPEKLARQGLACTFTACTNDGEK